MTSNLFTELGQIIGLTRRRVSLEERERVITAASQVDSYDELPRDVQNLLQEAIRELPDEVRRTLTEVR